jgi:hypothetical protein
MTKHSQKDWYKLANSPDYEDQFDELYEEEVVHQSKQRRKEGGRFGFKEDY